MLGTLPARDHKYHTTNTIPQMSTTAPQVNTTTQLYTPPNLASTTQQQGNKQRRLLLMGPPKWGKTWSALTFPNPIVVDFDRGLTEVKRDIPHLKMYDDEWVKNTLKNPEKTTALCTWLRNEGMKLSAEQTIVIDSLSTLCDVLTVELDKKTPVSKSGEKDGFWFWKAWSEWLRDFHMLLNRLPCNIVTCCHEQEVRDTETGRLLTYKFLIKGQDFTARLPQYYTDVFRQTRIPVEKTVGIEKVIEAEYKWQVQPDSTFQLCCTRIPTQKKFLPAKYESFFVG